MLSFLTFGSSIRQIGPVGHFDTRSLFAQACKWNTLFMIFHSPSTFRSVNKSV